MEELLIILNMSVDKNGGDKPITLSYLRNIVNLAVKEKHKREQEHDIAVEDALNNSMSDH